MGGILKRIYMEAIHVNNLRSELHSITNSVKDHMYKLSSELDNANASKSEKNEFEQLFDKMIEVVQKADDLIRNESQWLVTPANETESFPEGN